MDIFHELDKEFHFTLDAAADERNKKCYMYFDKATDAFKQDWGTHVAWLNPPGDEDPAPWVAKARLAAESGATVVALLRPGINTPWFYTCTKHGEIRYLTLAKDKQYSCPNCGQMLQFCIVIFRPKK